MRKLFVLLVLVVVGVAMVVPAIKRAARPEVPEQAPAAVVPRPEVPEWDKSPEAQARRRGLLQAAIDAGLIDRTEGTVAEPELWVGREWSKMSFEQRASAAHLVHQFYCSRAGDLLFLRDRQTGKVLGTYSARLGLRL